MPEPVDHRFRLAVEASPSGMLLVDSEGIILFCNTRAETLFGYDPGELLGKQVEVLVPQAHRKSHVGQRDGFVHDPEIRPMGVGRDLVGLRKDGTKFPAEIALTPVREGDRFLVLSSIVDITERKRAEAAREKERKDLKRMLYLISHDLKAPLRSIDGFAHHLLADIGSDLNEEALDYLNRIIRANQRMETLLTDLLRLAQVRASEDRKVVVDGGDLVEEVLANLEGEVERTGARIETDPSFPALKVERIWAVHALENLVGNALRFTREGETPQVRIGGYRAQGDTGILVGFVVSDRGPGVPEDEMTRIFELFRQGSRGKGEGTGAGLAIAREIAERDGGRCFVRNRPGGGAEFVLAFGGQEGVGAKDC